MSWLQSVGILLVSASVAFLYYFRQHRPFSVEDDGQPSVDPMGMRLAAHIQRVEDFRRRLSVAVTLAALVAGVMLLIISDHGGRSPNKTSDILPGTVVSEGGKSLPKEAAHQGLSERASEKSPQSSQSGQSNAVSAFWAAAAMGGVAVTVGAALLVLGPTRWVRAVGAGTLAVGLTTQGYLVKEVKFGELFKFDTHIDKIALELELKAKLKQLSEFGPERLIVVENFESGKAELRPEMDEPITKVCRRWKEQGGKTQLGLLLIAGSADRVPLAGPIRTQYESNVGLARARAEQVRARVLNCGVPAAQIVTLVSGPRNTPAVQHNQTPAGFAEDRSVVVWALWSVPIQNN
jgi:flagellar motor protein MotB